MDGNEIKWSLPSTEVKQESRAVAWKPRDTAVGFHETARLSVGFDQLITSAHVSFDTFSIAVKWPRLRARVISKRSPTEKKYLDSRLEIIQDHTFWHRPINTSYMTLYRQLIVFLLSLFALFAPLTATFSHTTPITPEIWLCSAWTKLILLGAAGKENPSLIKSVIVFEL